MRTVAINFKETNPDIVWGIIEMLEGRGYLCTRNCSANHFLVVINHLSPFSYYFSDDKFSYVNYMVTFPRDYDYVWDALNEIEQKKIEQ